MPASVSVTANRPYMPELEGLRGIAALLVLGYHLDALVGFPIFNSVGSWPPLPLAFLYAGHTGVTLFFVLSAFLLAIPFLAEADGGPRVDRVEFYRRRALRILPLYWAFVLVATVAAYVLAMPHALRRGLAQALFGTTISMRWEIYPFTAVLWSLSTEIQFYLLLPFLPLVLRRRWRLASALLVGMLAYAALLHGSFERRGADEWALRHGLLGRWPAFAMGIVAAALWRRHRDALVRRLPAPAGDLALVACLAALAALLRPVLYNGYMTVEVSRAHGWHAVEGALWATVLLLVATGASTARRLLSSRVLVWLGTLSYSIYLLHYPILYYWIELSRRLTRVDAGWHLGQIPWAIGAVALVLATAAATYRWIEEPFLRRKARLA